MPSQCVAWNCPTRRRGDDSDDQTITFHSFPMSRPDLLAKWLESMGESVWKPQRGSVLCSKHFERDCFLQNYATPRLKQGAVPSMFDKRPNSHIPVDLDKRTAHELLLTSTAGNPLALNNNAWSQDRPRRRKIARRYDPEEEVTNLRQMLEDERIKRRELEQEVFKLRQEKSEMSAKMNKLEASRCKPNIPQSLIPILVDAMSRGVDPLKRPDSNKGMARTIPRPVTIPASKPPPPVRAPIVKPTRYQATQAALANKTPQSKPVAAPGSTTAASVTPTTSVSGNSETAAQSAASQSSTASEGNGGDSLDSEMQVDTPTNEPSTSAATA